MRDIGAQLGVDAATICRNLKDIETVELEYRRLTKK